MLHLERFVAADEKLDQLSNKYINIPGVIGVALEETPFTGQYNPGGPRFVVYVKKEKKVRLRQLRDNLPTTVSTIYGDLHVVLVEGKFHLDSHTEDENPIKPGASISGSVMGNGTLGAVVSSPGSGDHFITCRHVVDNIGSDVYQSGKRDARDAFRSFRVVGTVISNSGNVNDSAIVKINNPFSLDPNPHDSDIPSSSNPAIGLYRGRTPDDKPFYINIDDALQACGGSMDHTTLMNPLDKGRKVYASGRTSSQIISEIDSRAIWNSNGGIITGFLTNRVKGAFPGDSGAVCTISRGLSTSLTTDGTEFQVVSTDIDNAAEYLPGEFRELDEFLEGDGSGITISGTTIDSTEGKSLLSRLASKLRKLGELEIVVTADGYMNPCIDEGRRRRRPTNCREIILREDQENEIPDEDPSETEELESETLCCTFGRVPVVLISGDDSEETNFNLTVTGAATIKVTFSIKQKVLSAKFKRYGSCYRNICGDPEVIKGTVKIKRTIKMSIEGSLAGIELPIIGSINAGSGGYNRTTNKSIRKRFVLSCSAQ